MDTVEPSRGKQAVTDENGHITSCGDTVLGADDFAGVSAILEGVASLLESGATHPTLELLFTTGEEHFVWVPRHLMHSACSPRRRM